VDEKLVEIITQMQSLAPAATAQAVHAVWLKGVIDVLSCVGGFGAAYLFGLGAQKLYAKHLAIKGDEFTYAGLAAIGSGFLCGILAISATFSILMTSTRMAVLDPQAALAMRVIGAIAPK
jgi:hypothetical protein